MDVSIWLWLLLAVIIFWLVGLYNRLMRIRVRAMEVLVAMERQVGLCLSLLESYGASQRPNDIQADAGRTELSDGWAGLVQAARLVEAIWGASRKNGLSTSVQLKRSESWTALQLEWDALIATPPDLAGAPVPDAMRMDWESHRQKAKSIQDALNAILDSYNEAVHEYPARWVATLMGFEPTAKI